jgi:hypothetical protein
MDNMLISIWQKDMEQGKKSPTTPEKADAKDALHDSCPLANLICGFQLPEQSPALIS